MELTGTLRRQRLLCSTCHRRYPFAEVSGKPPIFDFGSNEPPTPSCRTHKNDSLCRYYVATRRTGSAEDLAPQWPAEEEIAWVTFCLSGGEISLADAEEICPVLEAARGKRFLWRAFQGLSESERANIKGVGAVELGLVEVRYPGERVRKLAIVHAHLLLWGIGADRIGKLLRPAMVKTEIVRRPLKVQIAHDPERLLGYALKHFDDHRTTVRGPVRAMFKRRPEGNEIHVQQRWCTFPATHAEVLYGLRRHPDGRITTYTRSRPLTPATWSHQSRQSRA